MQTEVLQKVESLRRDGNKTNNCAVDLCLNDINTYGYGDWLLWDSLDVASMFSEMTDDAVKDLLDEINSQQAGQTLIDEVLGVEQDRIDTLEESKKLALASSQMFKVLVKYVSIHEYLKLFYAEFINQRKGFK
jgi:hypothetical protein